MNELANHHASTQLHDPSTVPDEFDVPPVAFATTTRTADIFSALYSAQPDSLDQDNPPVEFEDDAEPYKSNTLKGEGKQPPNPMNAPCENVCNNTDDDDNNDELASDTEANVGA